MTAISNIRYPQSVYLKQNALIAILAQVRVLIYTILPSSNSYPSDRLVMLPRRPRQIPSLMEGNSFVPAARATLGIIDKSAPFLVLCESSLICG